MTHVQKMDDFEKIQSLLKMADSKIHKNSPNDASEVRYSNKASKHLTKYLTASQVASCLRWFKIETIKTSIKNLL